MIVAGLLLAATAHADPYNLGERAITGGLVGAGTGAVIGAIAGGGHGAGIGPTVGGGFRRRSRCGDYSGATAQARNTFVPTITSITPIEAEKVPAAFRRLR